MAVTFSLLDRSEEPSTMRVETSNDSAAEADITAALAGLLYTNALQSTTISTRTLVNPLPPTNNSAQRERKLLLNLRDTVNGRRFIREIGVFDASTVGFNSASDDIIIPGTGTPIDLLVTAFNTYVLSSYGNQVVVTNASMVGRNT